jgi:hypothetical protein
MNPSKSTAIIPVKKIMSNTSAPPITAFDCCEIGIFNSSQRWRKSAPIKTPIVPEIYARGAAFLNSFQDIATEKMLAKIAGKNANGKEATIPLF